MKTKLIVFSSLIFLISLIYTSGPVFAAFSAADFQGTWYGHALVSGPDSDWEYSTVTVDDQGNFTSTNYTSAGGTPYQISDTMNINDAGIMTMANHPTAHGVVSSDKNIMVFTNTWNSSAGDYGIQVLVKGGGSFTQSDLTGTWYEHKLSSGIYGGWEYGTVTIDSGGSVSIDTINSEGQPQTASDVATVSISADGILSVAGDPTMHGVMSPGKDIAVFTDTSDSGAYGLTVLVKGGGSFSLADLTGTWYGHSIMSGSGWGTWTYGPIAIDSNGSGTDYMTTSENTSESGTYTLSITGDGIISAAESPSFHGIMNLGKNISVFTETDSTPAGSGYNLMIGVKVSGSPPVAGFSATPLSGNKPLQVAFTDSSTGDITGWSWDFGDGSTSTEQNPSHTYSKPGRYTVSLTVTGLLGTNVYTKTDYIDVKSPGMPWLPILLDN